MEKNSFFEGLLRVLTLGLYGRGRASKKIKRYTKDGVLRVEKEIDRQGIGAISNNSDIINSQTLINNDSFNE